MTSIVSSPYSAGYIQSGSVSTLGSGTSSESAVANRSYTPATSVTLSAAAKAALAQAADEQATDEQAGDGQALRTKMDAFLESISPSTLLKEGRLVADLSSFSRDEVFAISSNSGNNFSPEEQKAAKIELDDRFSSALRGGKALMEVTGDYTDLYEQAYDYLQNAGPEEQKSSEWQASMKAVMNALQYLKGNGGGQVPAQATDPVAKFLQQSTGADGDTDADTISYAAGARTALDRLYDRGGDARDVSTFGSKTLSAIATNDTGAFTSSEILSAKREMKTRLGADVQQAFQSGGLGSDPTTFSKYLIAQYSSMTTQEREAAGLDQNYYNTIMQNYETSQKISQMLGTSSSGGGTSLLNYL